MSKKSFISKQIKTNKFRVSFPNVHAPKADMQGNLKFGLSMIFDSVEDIAGIRAIVKEAAIGGFGSVPQGLKVPWSKGDEKKNKQTGETYDGYTGKIIINASSKQRVGIVDCEIDPATGKLHVLTNEEEFYGGCFAIATVTAWTWDNIGGQGVSIGLQNIQKVEDGEKFSGKTNAEDDFSPIKKPDIASDLSVDDGLGGL
jgi:hypothetical protein